MYADEYGSMYVAGTFSGSSSSLGESTNKLMLGDASRTSGTFMGKFAKVTNISGTVVDIKGNPIKTGYVKVYGFTRFHKSPLADSVKLNDKGEYTISKVPFGKYLLYASPFTANFNDFAPTYYPSTTYWDLASYILVDTETPVNLAPITVKDRPIHNGSSLISGNVSLLGESNLKATMGKPARQASVVLMQKKPKADFDLVVAAMTVTDADGNFSFTGVDNGEYALLVDETGLPSQMYDPVTIVDGTTYNLDFIIEEDSVAAPSPPPLPSEKKENLIETCNNYILFPNPAADGIINFRAFNNNEIFEVSVYDLTGKEVYILKNIVNQTKINLSEKPVGTYILKVKSENTISTNKLIVK
jgi:hypothetical protein